MSDIKKRLYDKRAQVLIKNLKSRHFDAYYCADQQSALEKALSLIPEGVRVGWGGTMSAQQIGLLQAVKDGPYQVLDRDLAKSPEERIQIQKSIFTADVFITGANALSIDGQMVNIDGTGNRVAPIIYGPDSVIVIAGMNKVTDDLNSAMQRARTVAAPANQQRFMLDNPCSATGMCADCKSEQCICNQIVITRHCRPIGRIKFILVGEDLGL